MSFFCPQLSEKFSASSASEIYEFLDEFENHDQFREFARTGLGLSEAVVNDIEDEEKTRKEQRFKMIRKWVSQNGRQATKKKLYELYEKFVFVPSEEDALSPLQESLPEVNPSCSQNSSNNSAADEQPDQTNDQQQNEISSEANDASIPSNKSAAVEQLDQTNGQQQNEINSEANDALILSNKPEAVKQLDQTNGQQQNEISSEANDAPILSNNSEAGEQLDQISIELRSEMSPEAAPKRSNLCGGPCTLI